MIHLILILNLKLKGNCFRFNTINIADKKYSTNAGRINGLMLSLFLEHLDGFDNFFSFTSNLGILDIL